MQINKLSNSTYIFILSLLLSTLTFANTLAIDMQKITPSSNSIQIKITNNSNKDIKIQKNDIAYEHIIQKNIFDIFSNSVKVPYIGKSIKFNSNKKEYIILHPYESYITDVNLERYYDLPSNEVIIISYKNGILDYDHHVEKYFYSFTTSVRSNKNELKLLEKISVAYNQCSESQIQAINNATVQAKELSRNAYETLLYEQSINIWSQKYTTWFGSPNITRQNHVLTALERIKSTLKTETLHFDCSCKDIYYAYIYPNIPYNIYLCDGFWSAETNGRDSQAGVLVNQLSQFDIVANTENHTAGEYEAKLLAQEFPYYTVTNADSYEYFIEDSFTEYKEFLWLIPILSLML